jgi:hypothetical protein
MTASRRLNVVRRASPPDGIRAFIRNRFDQVYRRNPWVYVSNNLCRVPTACGYFPVPLFGTERGMADRAKIDSCWSNDLLSGPPIAS